MKKTVSLILAATMLIAMSVTVCAEDNDDKAVTFISSHGYEYIGNSYDVMNTRENGFWIHDDSFWDYFSNEKGYTLQNNIVLIDYKYSTVRVPNRYTRDGKKFIDVTEIKGSCAFKKFDVYPKSKYLKVVDNVVFSMDGKTLMSYAQFDKRNAYEIPEGTEIIGELAFDSCENIVSLKMPDSVKEIGKDALNYMPGLETVNISPSVEVLDNTFTQDYNLREVYIPENSKLKEIKGEAFLSTKVSEVTLPSFDIKIESDALSSDNGYAEIEYKSYVKLEVTAEKLSKNSCRLKWDKIPKATYYEVYKKQKDGSYKLFKTVKGRSLKINGLKIGGTYTYAVKPVAVTDVVKSLKLGPYDGPETVTIHGTMSEDVTIKM